MPCHACYSPVECELCESCSEHCTGASPNDFDGHRAQMTEVIASTDPGAKVWRGPLGR